MEPWPIVAVEGECVDESLTTHGHRIKLDGQESQRWRSDLLHAQICLCTWIAVQNGRLEWLPRKAGGVVGRMNQVEPTLRPDWVSDDMYPFESRFFATASGHRMHYVDEGDGEPIVFVHGNPTWSFEFRHVVRELRSDFRCIAPDHIGFGLSSRSNRREDHHPESHARRFAALLDHLGLRGITLVMNDWGGPIGLDFARRHPERIRRLVIANTWCWPVGDDFHFKSFSFLMSSWIGQYLIRHRNMFVNSVMPRAVSDSNMLTPEIMAYYRNAQPAPAARAASAALPGYITGASDWLRSIWPTARPLLISQRFCSGA